MVGASTVVRSRPGEGIQPGQMVSREQTLMACGTMAGRPEGGQLKEAELRLTISAIAICGVLNSTACRAESKPSLGQQFIDGHNAVSFSILVPVTEGEKRVENVKVTCNEGKCQVRVESISQRACGDGMSYPGRGFVPFDEMIQINDYGPEEKNAIFRPKVTPGGDEMLIERLLTAANYAVDIDALGSSKEHKQDFATLFRKA